MASISLNGFLSVGGSGCGGCGGGGTNGDGCVEQLDARCGLSFESAVRGSMTVRTEGMPGDVFVPVAFVENLIGIEFLYAKTSGPMVLCLGSEPAKLVSDPFSTTGFTGGEAMLIDFQGTDVTINFEAGDQDLNAVVNRINAAFALLGIATPRASAEGGRLVITGTACSVDPNDLEASTLVAAAYPAPINFANQFAVPVGSEIQVNGTLLVELPSYPAGPTSLQVSGQGSIEIIAAGRSSR